MIKDDFRAVQFDFSLSVWRHLNFFSPRQNENACQFEQQRSGCNYFVLTI